jgi:Ca2+-transporting ATPase
MEAAHIGVAMGKRGTDVAREAASIVLLDDDFGSIVKTIRLGRRIYDNLRKALNYIIAIHVPIAGLALLPLLIGAPLILAPIQIAFLEMVIDPACSVVFEAEGEERDVMGRPPRNPRSPLLPPLLALWAAVQGMLAFAVVGGVLIFAWLWGMPENDLRALVFTTLVLVNVGLILANRSFSVSLLAAFLRPNRALWLLLSCVFAVLGVALYLPAAKDLFRFGTLHGDDLLACLAAGAVILVLLEIVKPYWREAFRRADSR